MRASQDTFYAQTAPTGAVLKSSSGVLLVATEDNVVHAHRCGEAGKERWQRSLGKTCAEGPSATVRQYLSAWSDRNAGDRCVDRGHLPECRG